MLTCYLFSNLHINGNRIQRIQSNIGSVRIAVTEYIFKSDQKRFDTILPSMLGFKDLFPKNIVIYYWICFHHKLKELFVNCGFFPILGR